MGIKIGTGFLCLIASLSAGAIYLFGFGNEPLSLTALFWAAPLLSPVAWIVYIKFRTAGMATQAALYVMAIIGAYHVIQNDCSHGNCTTQSKPLIALSGTISGVHMICMLAALVLMFYRDKEAISDHV